MSLVNQHGKRKTLTDYQKLIRSGYTLSNQELRDFNRLHEQAHNKTRQSLKDKDAEIERLEKELKDAAEYMIESGIAT